MYFLIRPIISTDNRKMEYVSIFPNVWRVSDRRCTRAHEPGMVTADSYLPHTQSDDYRSPPKVDSNDVSKAINRKACLLQTIQRPFIFVSNENS